MYGSPSVVRQVINLYEVNRRRDREAVEKSAKHVSDLIIIKVRPKTSLINLFYTYLSRIRTNTAAHTMLLILQIKFIDVLTTEKFRQL